MKMRMWITAVLAAVLFAAGTARAQQPAAPNPLDVVPEKMPFSTPYGAPISLERARAVIQAAVAESNKRGWAMNISVLDSGGNLVAFERMDGAQIASISISEHKGRAAVKFRRPTKVFEDAIQKSSLNYIMTLDDVVASRGGVPLIENGKLIGSIGVSGGTGSQDEVVALAGAGVVNK
jgi:glc operon protein GlcG